MARQTSQQKNRQSEEKQKKERRASTSRANGRKSQGPKTKEGRANISHASLRHGMRASRRDNPLLLPFEDSEKLQEITDTYYDHIRPQTKAEAALVDVLVCHIWRAARLICYEAELLTDKAEDLQPTLAEAYESISPIRLYALAFQTLNGKNSANPTLNRYLVSTRNMYHSALADIEKLRKLKGDPDSDYIKPPRCNEVRAFSLDWKQPDQPGPVLVPDPVPEEPEPEPVREPEPEIPAAAEAEPALDAEATLADTYPDAVRNPYGPDKPGTIWIPVRDSRGRIIRDLRDNPVLKPIHLPQLPGTAATHLESTPNSK